MPIDVVLVIAVPRTGSTQLGRLLTAYEQLRVHGEVFHPNESFSLRRHHLELVGHKTGRHLVADAGDPTTIETVRANPATVLESLREAAGGRVVVVKLLPGHLHPDVVCDQLIPDPTVGCLFLRRRLIDSYVSERKAVVAGTYERANTTAITVQLDIDHFARWRKGKHRWYQRCWRAAQAAPHDPALLTYEDDLTCDPSMTLDAVEAIFAGWGVSLGDRRAKVPSLRRQDHATDLADKVDNWAEFEAHLRERDLYSEAFSYFL